jgi:hypothetical protein
MGKVVNFPDRFLSCRRYRISLYTDFEVELVLAALNTYPECDKRYNADMLQTLDPIFVRKALDFSIVMSPSVQNTTTTNMSSR